jgi:hypothetical protein
MSRNRWDVAGVPHKGWACIDVVDLRGDGTRADETSYETCQMCGNEKIRFVHVMAHADVDEPYRVGCICAEKMSGDYQGPRRREGRLRNRAVRRSRWLDRRWRVSAKGNPFLNIEGHNLGVYKTKAGRWGYRIGNRFGQRTYAALDEAKLALFDDFWAMTQDDDRMWASG